MPFRITFEAIFVHSPDVFWLRDPAIKCTRSRRSCLHSCFFHFPWCSTHSSAYKSYATIRHGTGEKKSERERERERQNERATLHSASFCLLSGPFASLLIRRATHFMPAQRHKSTRERITIHLALPQCIPSTREQQYSAFAPPNTQTAFLSSSRNPRERRTRRLSTLSFAPVFLNFVFSSLSLCFPSLDKTLLEKLSLTQLVRILKNCAVTQWTDIFARAMMIIIITEHGLSLFRV